MPAASTPTLSVQVLGFEDSCLLTQRDRLVCDFCSSGQRFACGFLQIPPHDGHPCRPANSSPCRVCRGLAPPGECAMPGAQQKGSPQPAATPRPARRQSSSSASNAISRTLKYPSVKSSSSGSDAPDPVPPTLTTVPSNFPSAKSTS